MYFLLLLIFLLLNSINQVSIKYLWQNYISNRVYDENLGV